MDSQELESPTDKNRVISLRRRLEAGFGLLGRRSEPRFEASGPVRIYDGGSCGRLLEIAHLRNVSASGVCVAMETRLMPGHRVHLIGPGLVRNGDAVVRHSGAGYGVFIVGLEFVDGGEPESRGQGLPAAW